MEVALEVLVTPGLRAVLRGGIVGILGNNKVVILVHEHPMDEDFDFKKVAPLPKETARKGRNRKYRQNRRARRIICGGGIDGNRVRADEQRGDPKRD